MFYLLDGNTISGKDHKSINIIQSNDPITQKPFISSKNALDWLKNEIKTIYCVELLPLNISVIENDGNETKSIIAKKVLTIKVETNIKNINGKYKAYLLNTYGKQIDILEFNFVDGVATLDYVFEESGEYTICFYKNMIVTKIVDEEKEESETTEYITFNSKSDISISVQ